MPPVATCKTMFSFQNSPSQPAKPCFHFKTARRNLQNHVFISKQTVATCKTMFSFQNSPSQPAKDVFKIIWHFCSPAKRSFIFKTHFRNPRRPLPKPLGPGGTPLR